MSELAMENGLVKLNSLEDGFRFSRAILQSGLAPKSFSTEQSILIAMQMGAELGLPPLMSLKLIKVVNGTPSLGGKDMPSVVMRSGLLESWDEWFEGSGDDYTAHCKVKRKGVASERTSKFSVADAKKAGLWGKSGPWMQYPKDMLTYKARARAFQIFSDVLAGLPVTEDIQEVGQQAKTPSAPVTVDPLLQLAKQADASVIPEPQVEQPKATGQEAKPEEVAQTNPPGAASKGEAPAPTPEPERNLLGEKANEIASDTAGMDQKALRKRTDQMFELIGKELFTRALKQMDLDVDKIKKLDAAGLRRLLGECASEANALPARTVEGVGQPV